MAPQKTHGPRKPEGKCWLHQKRKKGGVKKKHRSTAPSGLIKYGVQVRGKQTATKKGEGGDPSLREAA